MWRNLDVLDGTMTSGLHNHLEFGWVTLVRGGIHCVIGHVRVV